MITQVIDYIVSADHNGKYEAIEIAKGKNYKGNYLKKLKRRFKRFMRWQ